MTNVLVLNFLFNSRGRPWTRDVNGKRLHFKIGTTLLRMIEEMGNQDDEQTHTLLRQSLQTSINQAENALVIFLEDMYFEKIENIKLYEHDGKRHLGTRKKRSFDNKSQSSFSFTDKRSSSEKQGDENIVHTWRRRVESVASYLSNEFGMKTLDVREGLQWEGGGAPQQQTSHYQLPRGDSSGQTRGQKRNNSEHSNLGNNYNERRTTTMTSRISGTTSHTSREMNNNRMANSRTRGSNSTRVGKRMDGSSSKRSMTSGITSSGRAKQPSLTSNNSGGRKYESSADKDANWRVRR
eukprot:g916.t1